MLKWIVGIAGCALVLSLFVNDRQAKELRQYRAYANEDLTLGLATMYDTATSLQKGDHSIPVIAYEGIGRLQSADNSLPGISGIGGLEHYFDDAVSYISSHRSIPAAKLYHYIQVMMTTKQSLAILNTDYRYMTHAQLQKAVDIGYGGMTANERQKYEPYGE